MRIYQTLLGAYGPQRWWPTTLDGHASPSYHGRPLCARGKFEVAVGAVLTQNTNWGNVERALGNLLKADLLAPERIMGVDDDLLLAAIRPSGYYNIKLRRLRSLTAWWRAHVKDGKLSLAGRPMTFWRESLLEVKGVGRETADSILLYCFDLPTFVIDAYTKRIMARHFGTPSDVDYDELRSLFLDTLPEDAALFKEFHALFVQLAKEACRKAVCLEACPLR